MTMSTTCCLCRNPCPETMRTQPKKMSTIVVVHMSANKNTCQSIVYAGLVCLCVAQQVTIKGACTVRTLSVCSFLRTWLEKNWWSSSLVTTVTCTKLVFPVTMHLPLCLQMPRLMVGMDRVDPSGSKDGEEEHRELAQATHRKRRWQLRTRPREARVEDCSVYN